MTLEDFFKAKGPDTYVEFPPKEAPSLEQFFTERTLAPKAAPKMSSTVEPGVQASVDTAPKLSDQDVDRLAAQANPQMSFSSEVSSSVKGPMEVPTAPSPAPAQPTVDRDAQFKMLIEEMGKNKPQASWGDLLTGLIPVGLDVLLGGGKGYALPASVGYYNKVLSDVEKKGASLESKIADIQKLRASEMLKEPKTLEVNVEGKPIITPVSQAIGKEAYKSPAKSGLTFAEKAALEKLKFGLKAKLDQGKATKEEQKRLQDIEMKLAEKWEADPFTRDTKTVAASYNALSKVDPYSPDPVKDIAVIFDFMKTLDPRSVVRESEQTLVMGARSIQDILNNLIEVKSGQRKLTPEQVMGIQRFAANNYQRRLDSQKSVVDEQFRKRAEKYGVNPDMVVGDLSVGVPVLWQNTKTKKWSIVPLSQEQADFAIKNLGAKKVE